MTIRARIFLSLVLSSAACVAQGYHDPALDGINLNLGYMNSDLNGNLEAVNSSVEGLPNAMAMTNYAKAHDYMQTGTSNHVEGYVGQDMDDVMNQYELGAEASAIGSITTPVSNLFTNFSAAFNLGSSNHIDGASNSWSSFSFAIPLLGDAPDFMLHFDNSALAEVGGENYRYVMYNFILLLAYLYFAWTLAEDLKKELGEALDQRQVQGTHVSGFGFEVSAPLAVAYAVGATVLLAVALTAIFNYSFASTIRTGASASGMWSYLGMMAEWPRWGLITSWVPITSLVVLLFSYLFFRFILLTPLFFGVRALIFWLVV